MKIQNIGIEDIPNNKGSTNSADYQIIFDKVAGLPENEALKVSELSNKQILGLKQYVRYHNLLLRVVSRRTATGVDAYITKIKE
jgi:hypothetical protein